MSVYIARRLPPMPVIIAGGPFSYIDQDQIERRGRITQDLKGRPALRYKGHYIRVAAGGSLAQYLPARIAESTGTVFYVGGAGASDSNVGSSGSPWATIQHAINTLTNNQKALVRTGTYTEHLDIGTTHTQTVTIEADIGATPTISGYVIIHSNAAYWRLRNLIIDGTSAGVGGVLLTQIWDNASHIEYYGCTIQHATEVSSLAQGMYVEGPGLNDLQIWNTIFKNNGSNSNSLDHGIYVHSTPASGIPILLGNCIFIDNTGFGVQLYPACNNALVVNCLAAYNVTRCGYTLSQNNPDGSNNNRVANSISYHNDSGGRDRGGPSGFDVQYVAPGSSPINHIDNYIGYLNGGTNTGYNIPPANAGVVVTNPLEADPLFVNPGARDFHLSLGSPASDYAIPEYCPTFDFTGASR